MAKKTVKKPVKKSVKSSTPKVHHGTDDHTFIMIAGGGLVVLVLIFFISDGFGMWGMNMSKKTTPTTQSTELTKIAANTVVIRDNMYGPETLVVKKGTTVTFENADLTSHTVTAADGSFDTGLLAQGEKGTVTFDEVGEFSYFCEPHPYMKGTVVVEE